MRIKDIINEIMKDKNLNPQIVYSFEIPDDFRLVEISCRSAFIFLRIKAMIKADPFIASSPDPPYEDIEDSKVKFVKEILSAEIVAVPNVLGTILSKIVSERLHLSFSEVDGQARGDVRTYLKATPEVMRDRIVMSIVWRTLGQNISLLGQIDDLYYLVNRRLRIAERMMYNVGKGRLSGRTWNIKASPDGVVAGAWIDNWPRMFEYPRLLQAQMIRSGVSKGSNFNTLCNPDPHPDLNGQKCRTEAMDGWIKKGDLHLLHDPKLNVDVQNMWLNPPLPPLFGNTTPPTVVSTNPSSNATGVEITSLVTAEFSEPVQKSTVTPSTFTLKAGNSNIAGLVTLSADNITATFVSTTSLSASTSYIATITTSVKDLAGNAMTSAKSWSFTTDAPSATPTPRHPVHLWPNYYVFFFNRHAMPKINPIDAIKMLFTPHEDFKERNLLFCDQVIHCLHLESLVFAQEIRGVDPNWLREQVDLPLAPGGWVRIWNVISDTDYDGAKKLFNLPFFLGQDGSALFEHKEISERELIVGDHVVIWNHPAYDNSEVDSVWRLENAIVVQTDPDLRLQGHGTYPLKKEVMVNHMMDYFKKALTKVQDLAISVPNGGPTKEIDFGAKGKLIFRDKFTPNHPGHIFDSNHQYANWWLVWRATSEESEVAEDSSLRNKAERRQKITYILGIDDAWYGAFPLWLPVRKGNKFVTNAQNEISLVEPVKVIPEMFSVWTMFIPKSHKSGRLVAIRPKL